MVGFGVSDGFRQIPTAPELGSLCVLLVGANNMKLFKNIKTKNSFYFFLLSILFSWPIFFVIDAWIFPNLMKQGESERALFLFSAVML